MEKLLSTSWVKFAHLPPRARTQNERVLLVMHGLGDSLEGYRFLPELLKIPGLHYLLVNAPDSYFTGFSWFDIYGGNPKPGIVRSRDLLVAVVDELAEQGFPASKVGVFGFSQGCLMALDLACRYPQPFGAVVGVSGYVGMLNEYPEKLSPAARAQKIFVTHGTMDNVLPLAQSESQVRALQGMGLSIDWKVYEKEHTIDPYQEVQDIRTFLVRNLMK
jgi:phospholipase/carboxylesterase